MYGYSKRTCCQCNVNYWIPESLADAMERTRNDKNPIASHCPYGHGNVRKSDNKISEEERVRLERDRLKQQLAYKDDLIDQERRSASAYKGQVTRLKNSAKNGVCPCCNRHFENLERHMKSKHPDFVEAA